MLEDEIGEREERAVGHIVGLVPNAAPAVLDDESQLPASQRTRVIVADDRNPSLQARDDLCLNWARHRREDVHEVPAERIDLHFLACRARFAYLSKIEVDELAGVRGWFFR